MKYNDDIALDNYLLGWSLVFFSEFQITRISANHISERMETIYLVLEKVILWSADTEALQDFRSWMLSKTPEFDGYPATELMSNLFEHDFKLRRITQSEEYLLQLVQELAGKQTTPLEEKRLYDLQQRLRVVKKSHWNLQRDWFVLRDQLIGSTRRGFIECRSNLRWYLSDTLRRRCEEWGGCCSRGCQCCESRSAHTNSERKLGAGHCTVDCGCCSKARGFEFTPKETKDPDARWIRTGRFLDCSICKQLVSTSFWGYEYDELCLFRKWKWWLSKRIVFVGFTLVSLYYIGICFT
jgi:hypothetical protein